MSDKEQSHAKELVQEAIDAISKVISELSKPLIEEGNKNGKAN